MTAVPDQPGGDAVRAAEELSRLRHGLRTPLAIVLGFAELLQADEVDDATRRDYARRILEAGTELRDIIDSAPVE